MYMNNKELNRDEKQKRKETKENNDFKEIISACSFSQQYMDADKEWRQNKGKTTQIIFHKITELPIGIHIWLIDQL